MRQPSNTCKSQILTVVKTGSKRKPKGKAKRGISITGTRQNMTQIHIKLRIETYEQCAPYLKPGVNWGGPEG